MEFKVPMNIISCPVPRNPFQTSDKIFHILSELMLSPQGGQVFDFYAGTIAKSVSFINVMRTLVATENN